MLVGLVNENKNERLRLKNRIDKCGRDAIVYEFPSCLHAQKFCNKTIPTLLFIWHNEEKKTDIELVKTFSKLTMVVVIGKNKDDSFHFINKGIEHFFDREPTPQEISDLLEHAFSKSKEESGYIFVNSKRKKHKLHFTEIHFIKGAVDYIDVYTKDKKYLVNNTLKNIEKILPSHSFTQIHRSTIVNIHKIDFIEKGFVSVNDTELKISATHRKKTNERIQHLQTKQKNASNSQYIFDRYAFNESRLLCFSINKKGKIKQYNENLEQATGYSEAEIKALSFFDLVHESDKADTEKELRLQLTKQISVNFACRIKCKKNKYIWLSCTASHNNETQLSTITAYNISDDASIRKKLLATQKELEDYKYAIDKTAIVAITDLKGSILYANDLFCELSKYSRNELLGKNHRILNSREHNKAFFKNMWRTISSGEIWQGDIKNKTKDHQFYWVATTIIPIADTNKKITKYLSIRRDITERKQLEALHLERITMEKEIELAKETAKIKSELLDNMSHEIRSPMNGISGMIDLLLKSTESKEPQTQYLQTIKASSNELLLIVNNILDYAQLENKHLYLAKEHCDFQTEIQHCIATLQAQANEKNIALKIVIDRSLPPLLVNKKSLHQIVCNLLSNAVKFSDRGTVTLKCSHRAKAGAEHEIKFEVRDEGPGISEENQKLLFKPFTPLDASSVKKHEGTGLGLAISKKLVALMDGSMGVVSTLGKGSTFWFKFTCSKSKKTRIKKQHIPQKFTCLIGG